MAHICYIVNELRWFVTHRSPLAAEAIRRGARVSVICPPSEWESAALRLGVSVYPVLPSRGSTSLRSLWRSLRATYVQLRSLKPDLAHLVTVRSIIFCGLAANAARVPAIVYAPAGVGSGFLATGLAGGVRRVALSVAIALSARKTRSGSLYQNPEDQRFFEGVGLPTKSWRLVYGAGVDLQRFSPGDRSASVPRNLLFVGRLLRDKGVHELVAAWKLAVAADSVWRLRLVGEIDPPNPTSVSQNDIDEWASSGVEVLGHHSDIVVLIRQADAVVLPSYREGMPKALLEAAACGRPVLTTDVAGCRDAVVPWETGLLVPARNITALADALQWMWAHEAELARMGQRARLLAEEKFGVDQVVRATFELYSDLGFSL